ncbi:TIGR04141 family sporadically distributed protein [Riemerella anatipestifer]|nr:TIGR04141 family sporadically distributed protein [Riemerella anatipestifer]MDY3533173.1 TIGR04141 family sporadically distributed protein [Riemerella anatipestifer]MDY3535361.1 TIGR04141 family sporadically distributed protein [Riemerella anatipestifer]
MDIDSLKIDLKIFKIDKTYYEFREKSFDEMIIIMKDNHIKKLMHKSINIEEPKITEYEEGDFKFWFYCYKQIQEKFYWKVFLPIELTEEQDFEILEFSYVLFTKYKEELYCVIGGSGMNVIKKFIHPSYGIEIYQRIADVTSDNIIELNTRSIANNISSKKETFNFNQTISETLDYSNVPTKIKLKVRDELKDGLFKKYDLDTNLAIMEVGSYFYLRKRIDFSELKQLIIDIEDIYENNTPKNLTLFTKINDEELVIKLNRQLQELIIDDVLRHENPQTARKLQNEVIEIVHPSKLETFYECNKFLIRYKFSKGKKDIRVFDRNDLYFITTKYIYDNTIDINNRFEIGKDVYKLNIVGFIDDKEKTYGNLFSHITAEIEFERNKYFKIDGHWYILENQFLSIMNEDAKAYYTKYRLEENLLIYWNDSDDEDAYNKSYEPFDNYFVLDKVISENIELCDILYINDGTAYFIHVKDGFNTKMRDLYIQVILAAKRLSNDIKNTNGIEYLKNTLILYNSRNPNKLINIDDFINNIRDKKLNISFVMAFKNNHYKNHTILERIDRCNSNIAKYSLVQVVKEMQQFDFDIKLIDISEIKK